MNQRNGPTEDGIEQRGKLKKAWRVLEETRLAIWHDVAERLLDPFLTDQLGLSEWTDHSLLAVSENPIRKNQRSVTFDIGEFKWSAKRFTGDPDELPYEAQYGLQFAQNLGLFKDFWTAEDRFNRATLPKAPADRKIALRILRAQGLIKDPLLLGRWQLTDPPWKITRSRIARPSGFFILARW